MLKTFFDTKNCFTTYLNYTESYSYEDWMCLPSDRKAAALFVQFFPLILRAWDKATTSHTFYGDDEEAVETVIQYLMKNVPIIESNPKRFRAPYIYSVAYNCLYCIVHDRLSDKMWREKIISNVQKQDDGTELDMYDLCPDCYSNTPEYCFDIKEFWAIVEDLDADTREAFDKIFKMGRLPARRTKRFEESLETLRDLLADFVDLM